MAPRPLTIVFAVCHPDDEAIWAGGLLCELARIPFMRCFVICLSGQDPASPRLREFEAARLAAGYAGGVICGGPLRQALEPLPPLANTLKQGLDQLGIAADTIDLLVTHSPYGDEHLNPHHVQAHRELKAWSANRGIGFAHFACVALPGVAHRSLLKDLRRIGTLRLLQLARCQGPAGTPRYFVQFASDPAAKLRLVQCYASIGIAEHEQGYTMFSNPCEALYLQDDRALVPISALMAAMQAPGSSPLVEKRGFAQRAIRKIRRMMKRTA